MKDAEALKKGKMRYSTEQIQLQITSFTIMLLQKVLEKVYSRQFLSTQLFKHF